LSALNVNRLVLLCDACPCPTTRMLHRLAMVVCIA
jgi:hypothetical protein